MKVKDLKWYSPVLFLVGAILSFADPITDILTLVEFYRSDHKTWFGVGLTFVILPCFAFLPLYCFARDRELARHSASRKWMQTFLCGFHPFSAALARLEGFAFCLKKWYRGDDIDSSGIERANDLLKHIDFALLFGAFLESAPQFVIQLYAMIVQEEPVKIIQMIALPVSFVTLVLAFTTCDELVLNDPQTMDGTNSGTVLNWKHKLTLLLTNSIFLSCRLVAISYFTVSYKWWVLCVLMFHSITIETFESILFCQDKGNTSWKSAFHFKVKTFCLHWLRDDMSVRIDNSNQEKSKGRLKSMRLFSLAVYAVENNGMILLSYVSQHVDTRSSLRVTVCVCFVSIVAGIARYVHMHFLSKTSRKSTRELDAGVIGSVSSRGGFGAPAILSPMETEPTGVTEGPTLCLRERVKELIKTWYSLIVLLVGAILSFADPITDILTILEFYHTDHKTWFGVGLAFVILPCLVFPILYRVLVRNTQTILCGCHALPGDNRMCTQTILCGCHPFSAALLRLQGFVFYFKKWWRGDEMYSVSKEGAEHALLFHVDTAVLFETVLESAPQFILQMYAMSVQEEPVEVIQIISLPVSFLSLAWAFTTTDQLVHRMHMDTGDLKVKHKLVLFVTHLFLLSSRLFAVCYFTVSYKWWVIGVLLFHASAKVIVDTIIIECQCLVGLFSFILSCVLWLRDDTVFTCDDDEGDIDELVQTTFLRRTLLLSNVLFVLENFIMILFYYFSKHSNTWYSLPVTVCVCLFSLLGSVMRVAHFHFLYKDPIHI